MLFGKFIFTGQNTNYGVNTLFYYDCKSRRGLYVLVIVESEHLQQIAGNKNVLFLYNFVIDSSLNPSPEDYASMSVVT